MEHIGWYLLTTFGGACGGGFCRHLVATLFSNRFSSDFPSGILVVNISGAFAIGALWASGMRPGNDLYPLFIVGFLGGYTTVSSFALNTLQLIHLGRWQLASLNVASSVTLCLVAAFCGAWLFGHAS